MSDASTAPAAAASQGRIATTVALVAVAVFAVGTWAAFGSVALYAPETSPRLALPGSIWTLLCAAVAAIAYVLVRRPNPHDVAPLWLPSVALLPWLPLPIPAAALLWTGPLARALVFVAIAGIVVSEINDPSARAKARAYVRLWRRLAPRALAPPESVPSWHSRLPPCSTSVRRGSWLPCFPAATRRTTS
jgi:hypothetical protein